MIAAIDIGNSCIKGLIKNDEKELFFNTNSIEETIKILNSAKTEKVVFSTVVPKKGDEIFKYYFNKGKIIHKISTISPFSFKIEYQNQIGIDRICSLEGALSLTEKNEDIDYLLTIDLGTATTINILEFPDKFIGGLIAPGIKTMFRSLSDQTAQLPELNNFTKEIFFSNNTSENIQAGVLNSTIGLFERVINKLKSDNKKIKIFLTGGNAELIKNYLKFEFIYEKYIVLKGILKLAEKLK